MQISANTWNPCVCVQPVMFYNSRKAGRPKLTLIAQGEKKEEKKRQQKNAKEVEGDTLF